MGKSEAKVEELVSMIERGELRLPEMQRRYVWKSTRVRDLLDSLYRGYPSGAILLWETDEKVPLQEFAVAQQANPYQYPVDFNCDDAVNTVAGTPVRPSQILGVAVFGLVALAAVAIFASEA